MWCCLDGGKASKQMIEMPVEGLPPHLGTNFWFQKIGEACGGLVEVDRRTANFGLSV